ncbi:fatty acid desaturase family protein [Kordiimonas lacus]|uniref:Fatty acid desaturase n=1 Tax=Kordiimonas lacus TaxID=637679 RepID=A0A1G6YDC2_9PROT|nr:fatty acid desaturase [Kordiimonas lacus]SDD87586.1 Fatty acid desaturase [Kordiimonas lacus]
MQDGMTVEKVASAATGARTRSGKHPEAAAFPLKEARKLVKDLWKPNARVYWTDFTLSAGIGWGAVAVATLAPNYSIVQILALVVATLGLYRAVIFIHEIAHFRKGTFTAFRRYFNAFCGMPMMVPAYTYADVHIDHHKPQVYGTSEDGEYLPFAVDKPWKIVAFIVQALIVPGLLLLRYTVLMPLTLIIPPFRRYVWKRASSLVIDFAYIRPAPKKDQVAGWLLEDIFTGVYAYAGLGLMYLGYLPWKLLAVWYVVTILIFVLNGLRTLAAHAYRNGGRERMTQQEEFLDSVDIPGNRYISSLWAPVGLRFHATHHLFPGMPYHSLEKAYFRLKAELPDNRLYLEATRPSLMAAVAQLWREAKAAQKTA